MSKKIIFTNLAGNLGNDLIKAIYAKAYRLEANEIVVHKGKYNKYAVVTMYENPHGIVVENYTITI